MVFQLIPVSIVLWIATAISLAVGTYCETSNSPHFAHLWVCHTTLQASIQG